MARVRFVDQGLQVEIPLGMTVLEAARLAGAPLGSACGGQCACSTCHVYVESGLGLLSAPAEAEEDALDRAFDVRDSSRLGCQARLEREGEVAVRISSESLTAYYNEHPEARQTRR